MASDILSEQGQLVSSKLAYNVLKTIGAIVIIHYFLKKYAAKRSFNIAFEKLPGFRLKFYHIFGHLHFLISARLTKKPLPVHVYDFLATVSHALSYADIGISRVWQGNIPIVTVTKPDLVEVLLNHPTEIKKAWYYSFLHPWLGSGLLTSEGEKWRSRRKMLTPAFHFNILKDFLPIANKQSKILVDILQQHTKDEFVEVVSLVTLCSLDIVCESVLGKDIQAQVQSDSPYVRAIQRLTSSLLERMLSPWLWPDFCLPLSSFGRTFIKDRNLVHQFTIQLIAEQKAAKLARKATALNPVENDDDVILKRKKRALMDLLLDEHINNNSLSESDIREEVDSFTFAGHDTTAMGMSYALYLIGLHPWVQNRIHDELDFIFLGDDRDPTDEDLKNMKYLECVIKETLRLYPSVPIFGREITSDLDFNGYTVPRGTTCTVLSYVLHRDPDYFPNPEKFDPERFTMENSRGRHAFAYAPFSAGPRNCIGQRFALMEEKVVLSSILRKFKLRSLDPRDKVHILGELVLRPLNGLRVQIRERTDAFDFHTVYYRE